MSKKKLFSLAVVAIMIAILSMSSLAWFSDKDEITNNFMIADSDDKDPDDIFSVDVWENNPSGEQGKGDEDVTHIYKDILPGDVLPKKVIVENTGYYDQYIRVTVTVSDAAAWMEVLGIQEGQMPTLGMIVNDYDGSNTWYSIDNAKLTSDDTLVYILYYRNILKGAEHAVAGTPWVNDQVTVFTEVKIPSSMTQAQAALFASDFHITVKAEAVQTENLGELPGDYAADNAFAVVEQTQTIG